MRITQMEARRALRDPGGRAAMDALPELVSWGPGWARRALEAIEGQAHRGWVDELLRLEAEAARQGVQARWARALRACLGPGPPRVADGAAWRALARHACARSTPARSTTGGLAA